MTSNGNRPPSIRRRLLLFLIGSLMLVLSGAALVTYLVAVNAANNAYDRSLLDPVLDIADNVKVDAAGAHLDLPQKALEALVYDQVDKVIYQIRSPQNTIIDGDADLPPPPPSKAGEHVFFDSSYGGERIRVAALHTASGFAIQVGETLHKRNRLVGEILFAELASTLLIGLVAIALAWFAVARGLIPLEDLRAELLSRAPRDLRPLAANSTPIEILPVVKAFNRLLDHLRDASQMQQRFLANAAHQLRTPLAGLQMHLELLLRRDLPAEVRTESERMHVATVRASRLANQLLALAKAERPRPESRNGNRRLALDRRVRGPKLGARSRAPRDRPWLFARERAHPRRRAPAAGGRRQPHRQRAALHARRRRHYRAHGMRSERRLP